MKTADGMVTSCLTLPHTRILRWTNFRPGSRGCGRARGKGKCDRHQHGQLRLHGASAVNPSAQNRIAGTTITVRYAVAMTSVRNWSGGMFRSRLSDALHDDETVVDVADDLSGAAIWQSPRVRLDDNPPPGARPDVIDAFRTIFAARPQPPCWCLHGIGARTERRGVGSALMGRGSSTAGYGRCT